MDQMHWAAGSGSRRQGSLRSEFLLTQDSLKWLALCTMFIDHIGAGILEVLLVEGKIADPQLLLWIVDIDTALRMIGRVSFPLYAYLLVQGFLHTRSVPRYALRLFLFALLSEVPFDLLFYTELTLESQNIFWTLLIALSALWALRGAADVLTRLGRGGTAEGGGLYPANGNEPKTAAKEGSLRPSRSCTRTPAWAEWLPALPIGAAAMALANLMETDYAWKGILLILTIYLLRDRRFLLCTVTPALYLGAEAFVLLYKGVSSARVLSVFLQHLPVFASFCFIGPAVNKRRRRGHKYAFYLFYPGHLLLLWALRQLLYSFLF